MGINASHAKWIICMKEKYQIDFSSIATLGRQALDIADDGFLKKYFNVKEAVQEDGYSEKFWNMIAQTEVEVDSFDVSEYEHATVIHDMNMPISDFYKSKYKVVIDGGTLEHIFLYPQALLNAMQMVEKGGYLLLMTPTNNWCGHGFYQFSPELFYSVLTRENGYEIKDMSVMVAKDKITGVGDKFYKLTDNTQTGKLSVLTTYSRTSLLICARRIGDVPENTLACQQGYYISVWEEQHTKQALGSLLYQKLKKNKMLYRIGIWLRNRVSIGRFAKKYDMNLELKKYIK